MAAVARAAVMSERRVKIEGMVSSPQKNLMGKDTGIEAACHLFIRAKTPGARSQAHFRHQGRSNGFRKEKTNWRSCAITEP
jgi:hypothetical protein